MNFSTLVSAIDLSSVGTAILAVGAIMIAPIAIKWGTKMITRLFG